MKKTTFSLWWIKFNCYCLNVKTGSPISRHLYRNGKDDIFPLWLNFIATVFDFKTGSPPNFPPSSREPCPENGFWSHAMIWKSAEEYKRCNHPTQPRTQAHSHGPNPNKAGLGMSVITSDKQINFETHQGNNICVKF
jgi:hypothetical protein